MKFPESWLREWVNPPVGSAELDAGLTQAGIEVEARLTAVAPFTGVIVALITGAEAHPNAERLRVCRVETGAQQLQIVCGAPNARVGIKVPLAQVGACLPGGLQIKAAALRGVDSAGMLCSAKELGLNDPAGGLLELDADAPIGLDVREWLNLDEQIFELKLTPNRADCLSIRGLSFEVAAEHGLRVADPAIAPVALESQLTRAVRSREPEACPRYLGRVIDAVDLSAPTPAWMLERIERSGLRAISLGVDITNYVMLELGQPLHAFDDERLSGEIVVRFSQASEWIKLLDGSDVTLESGTLVIADDAGVQAIAGVMGGEASKTLATTRRLFLESAHFTPATVMGRARQLGLSSDAAYRFERGVDPDLAERAIERASALYVALAGGKPGPLLRAESLNDLCIPKPLRLRLSRLAQLLGLAVESKRVGAILSALGMEVAVIDADTLSVLPPSRRFDLAIEEDLIEEIARIVGFDAIKQAPLAGRLCQPSLPEALRPRTLLREQLCALGFQEAITFSFVSSALLKSTGFDPMLALALKNPLSADLERMRPSLIPGLLAALAFNLNRQADRVRLFELGAAFSADGLSEPLKLSGLMVGLAEPEQWGRSKRALDFHDLKGLVERLMPVREGDELVASSAAWLHPGQSAARLRGGVRVGDFGAIHPQTLQSLDLRGPIFAFEFDASAVLERHIPRARPTSRFPSIRRDLAFSVPREVAVGQVEAAARAVAGSLLKELRVFDVFADDDRDIASKSVAMGLILQDDSATLHDTVINEIVGAVVANVEKHCAAVLRS